ncbi:hypothetical protein GWI33_013639 [Rhynchophorus ferrugineus]|uniref:Uncharacterized protein n=1 Tax=Rhynchophorus ferrugineus TaxID=354439 RepID=A0A834IGM7_RHYFE|nr:hypothetical protein GWI33_013639 [Rhynchophorus ferrugineus]
MPPSCLTIPIDVPRSKIQPLRSKRLKSGTLAAAYFTRRRRRRRRCDRFGRTDRQRARATLNKRLIGNREGKLQPELPWMESGT